MSQTTERPSSTSRRPGNERATGKALAWRKCSEEMEAWSSPRTSPTTTTAGGDLGRTMDPGTELPDDLLEAIAGAPYLWFRFLDFLAIFFLAFRLSRSARLSRVSFWPDLPFGSVGSKQASQDM
jgi:hypothetical protein